MRGPEEKPVLFLNYIRTPQRAPLLLMAFGELVLITLNLEL